MGDAVKPGTCLRLTLDEESLSVLGFLFMSHLFTAPDLISVSVTDYSG